MQNQGLKTIAPLSRGLPKTGQEISYANYDDGQYEAGWWLGLLNANNRTRFIEKEFVSGEIVVVDLATSLMWPKDLHSLICGTGETVPWINAVAIPIGKSYGGFSDWRLANIIELVSLVNYGVSAPSIYTDVFDNYPYGYYIWSANTLNNLTTYASQIAHTDGIGIRGKPKTESYMFIACRSL